MQGGSVGVRLHGQPLTSRALSRLTRQWKGKLRVMLVCVLCEACSFLLDADVQQCKVDADCAVRGLARGTCVDRVCQAPRESSASPVTGAVMPDTDMSAAPRAEPASEAQSEGTAGAAAGAAAVGSSAVGSSPRGAAGSSGSAGSMLRGTAGARAGAGGMSSSAALAGSAAGASGSCPSSGCECMNNADCERMGVRNGVCSASICYEGAAQCAADKDCEALGPEYVGGRCLSQQCMPNPRWRCEIPPLPSATETRKFTVPLLDALSLAPLSDVTLTACQKRDLTCARPVAQGKTGRDGKLVIELPANFTGYLMESERADYMPALYFFPNVIPENGVLNDFPLLSSGAVFAGLAAALGTSVDQTRGHMMLIAGDCFGMYLPGIVFSSPQQDKSTVQFYVQNQLPSLILKETASQGQGGYLNFPVGTPTIGIKQVKTGMSLNEVTLIVRAGFVTVAFMRPQPRVDVAR